jgi:glutaredoxin 2
MLDAWFNPQRIEVKRADRTPEAQRAVDERTAVLALYHYDTCMFCARVRKVIALLSLNIELRNIEADSNRRRELIDGGGRGTVPCLRIEDAAGEAAWMYESVDIIRYLVDNFADVPAAEKAGDSADLTR